MNTIITGPCTVFTVNFEIDFPSNYASIMNAILLLWCTVVIIWHALLHQLIPQTLANILSCIVVMGNHNKTFAGTYLITKWIAPMYNLCVDSCHSHPTSPAQTSSALPTPIEKGYNWIWVSGSVYIILIYIYVLYGKWHIKKRVFISYVFCFYIHKIYANIMLFILLFSFFFIFIFISPVCRLQFYLSQINMIKFVFWAGWLVPCSGRDPAAPLAWGGGAMGDDTSRRIVKYKRKTHRKEKFYMIILCSPLCLIVNMLEWCSWGLLGRWQCWSRAVGLVSYSSVKCEWNA